MRRIARLGVLGASVVSAGCLTLGMGVASADTIFNTGPGSRNIIFTKTSTSETIRNTNNVNLRNQNFQTAVTGSASVVGNTNAGNSSGGNQPCWHRNVSIMPMHMPNHNNTAGQGGSASTGNASNSNVTQASVNITNSAPPLSSMGTTSSVSNSMSDTGPHSFNLISSKTTSDVQITNTNNVTIDNTNVQTAVSGNANVSGNTNGGSAMTGNATNVNSTRFDVAIANN